jgi:hypothetical protein
LHPDFTRAWKLPESRKGALKSESGALVDPVSGEGEPAKAQLKVGSADGEDLVKGLEQPVMFIVFGVRRLQEREHCQDVHSFTSLAALLVKDSTPFR